MKKQLFFLSLLLLLSPVLVAQVGINTETPNKFSELDIVNLISSDGKTIPKGILIPRMTEEERNKINLSSDSEKEQANSLLIYNTTEGCYNYYMKEDKEWKSLCGKLGKAVFTIDNCAVATFGEYKSGEATGPSHYLKMSVSVHKPGSYSISATATNPANNNGYFFTTDGEFLSSGTFEIIVPAMGTPKNYTTPLKDHFTIALNGNRSNGNDPACTFEIEVKNSAIKPRYTMSCSGTKVFGEYYEEVSINDGSHYIEVVLNVEPTSYGATYEIQTNEVDGIKFYGTGQLLPQASQKVILQGTGVPFDNKDKKLYIRSNSESSSATCLATVYIIIPPKKVLSIGRHTTPGYCIGAANTVSNNMITDYKNFGTASYSIVRYAGFKNVSNAIASNVIELNLANQNLGRTVYAREGGYFNGSTGDARLATYLEGTIENGQQVHPVDIVYIGWTGLAGEVGDWVPNAAQMVILRNFLNRGGIIMCNNENINFNRAFLRGIFNKNDIDMTTGTGTNPAGSVYQIENIQTDPVLNGPFGNIAGLYWGEDASTTVWASNLPMEDVLLYSNNKNLLSSSSNPIFGAGTLFRHRTLPLIWSGDGGFTAGLNSDMGVCCYPLRTGAKQINSTSYTNHSVSRPYASNYKVSNSTFTANALAWCIKTAEEVKRANKNN